MGKLDYQPNRQALEFTSRSLMPELERTAPGRFKTLICGGPVPSGSFHHSMVFAGIVPSPVPYMHRANICIAPLFSRSGTRLKILEYLAARKAVVSTPKGAEGLACRSGTHLLKAQPEEFAATVLELAENPERAATLGQAGYDLVRSLYDWRAIQPSWNKVLNRWMGSV